MFLEDMRYEFVKFFNFMAFIVIPFLMIGRLAGFWFEELFTIVFWWILIALGTTVCLVFLADSVGERFEQSRPLLLGLALGLAWYAVWSPIQRLAVDKAGFSGLFKPDLLPASVSMSLPWWSSLSFRLFVLVVLVGVGYGIGHYRANR